MPLPIEERTEVPCLRCGYTYPWAKLDDDRVCADRERCDGNLARQQRYAEASR